MRTQYESPAAASATVSGTSRKKLLQLLRKRLRQLMRATLVVVIGLALTAAAFAIWWLTSLNGLPDIGEPFDVAAFRVFSVPDDRNAFTYLRRAQEALTPSPPSVALSWSGADAGVAEVGSLRIAGQSNCFSGGPNNPTPRTLAEIPW